MIEKINLFYNLTIKLLKCLKNFKSFETQNKEKSYQRTKKIILKSKFIRKKTLLIALAAISILYLRISPNFHIKKQYNETIHLYCLP